MGNWFKESLNAKNNNDSFNDKKRTEITNSNIEQAYRNHICLKSNPQFIQTAINEFLQMAEQFVNKYPNVTIEPPRGRIKSNVSIKNKIKNMEIERICKLYALDKITDNEKEFLKQAILELIKNSKKGITLIETEKIIDEIFDGKIENLEKLRYITEQPVSEKAKTAILRITKARLQKENIANSKELQNELSQISIMQETDLSTGKQIFYDILKWKDIEEININHSDYEEKMRLLHNPIEYLVLKDLIGMKIVIGDIPDDIETDNQELKTLLQIRKKIKDLLLQKKKQENPNINEIKELQEQYNEYNESCRIEITKEFGATLREEENLSRLNLNLEKYKSKYKENGYRAEHFKYSTIDNPNYTFELQLRSLGCEIESRIGGRAPHSSRDGKEERNIYNVPQYFVLLMNDKTQKFKPHLCSKAENMEEFLRGYIDDEQLDELVQQAKREESQR